VTITPPAREGTAIKAVRIFGPYRLIALDRIGGLHHRDTWRPAVCTAERTTPVTIMWLHTASYGRLMLVAPRLGQSAFRARVTCATR